MRASFIVALVPFAMLAACNSANPPDAASDTTTYDPNREQPAAAQGNDGFGNSVTGDSTLDAPALPSEAIREGAVVPPAPEASPGTTSSTDEASDIIIDDTESSDLRLEGGTPVPQP